MNETSAKRVAKVKLTLTKRIVEALEPTDKRGSCGTTSSSASAAASSPPAPSPSSSTTTPAKAGGAVGGSERAHAPVAGDGVADREGIRRVDGHSHADAEQLRHSQGSHADEGDRGCSIRAKGVGRQASYGPLAEGQTLMLLERAYGTGLRILIDQRICCVPRARSAVGFSRKTKPMDDQASPMLSPSLPFVYLNDSKIYPFD